MELLGALEAKKLTKQNWKQYCGTPCMNPKDSANGNFFTFSMSDWYTAANNQEQNNNLYLDDKS